MDGILNRTIQADHRKTSSKHLGELDHVSWLSKVPVLVFALQGISEEEMKHNAQRFPDMEDTFRYEVEAGAANVQKMTALFFMLCCVFVVLTANQVSLGKKVTLVSSSEVVVQLLLWQWPPSTGLETLFIFLCLSSCDVCLFSPFSAGPLSEVLLGKLQHVVLAVMQRSLIQISVSEPVQRYSLTIQKADSNHPGAISFYHFSREADSKKRNEKKHLYGSINFVRSHGGRHGDGHGRGRCELTRSSLRLCCSVQRQRQEVRGRDWVDAVGRKGAGAAEHSTELPAWHTERRDEEANPPGALKCTVWVHFVL